MTEKSVKELKKEHAQFSKFGYKETLKKSTDGAAFAGILDGKKKPTR